MRHVLRRILRLALKPLLVVHYRLGRPSRPQNVSEAGLPKIDATSVVATSIFKIDGLLNWLMEVSAERLDVPYMEPLTVAQDNWRWVLVPRSEERAYMTHLTTVGLSSPSSLATADQMTLDIDAKINFARQRLYPERLRLASRNTSMAR